MYGREQRIQKPSAKKLSVATDALLGGVLVAGIHVAVTVTKAVALSPFRPPAIGFFFSSERKPAIDFTCFIFYSYLHRTVGFGHHRRRPEQQRASPSSCFCFFRRRGKAGRPVAARGRTASTQHRRFPWKPAR